MAEFAATQGVLVLSYNARLTWVNAVRDRAAKVSLTMTEGQCKVMDKQKPLVYSCSGCSTVAQLANDIAVVMDREGHAEMSCIAGVGGDVESLVNVAKSGRDIYAIDGCSLACVKKTLARHDVIPAWHIELTGMGVEKACDPTCSIRQHYSVLRRVYRELGIIATGS